MARRRIPKDQKKLVEELAVRGIGYSTISVDEHLRQEARRQRQLGIVRWPDFGKLKFPGWFTIHLDYFATGEGSTRGIAICACSDKASLERHIIRTFGSFYGQGVEVRQEVSPLPGYEDLVPPLAQTLLSQLRRRKLGGIFEFHVQLHLNCS